MRARSAGVGASSASLKYSSGDREIETSLRGDNARSMIRLSPTIAQPTTSPKVSWSRQLARLHPQVVHLSSRGLGKAWGRSTDVPPRPRLTDHGRSSARRAHELQPEPPTWARRRISCDPSVDQTIHRRWIIHERVDHSGCEEELGELVALGVSIAAAELDELTGVEAVEEEVAREVGAVGPFAHVDQP